MTSLSLSSPSLHQSRSRSWRRTKPLDATRTEGHWRLAELSASAPQIVDSAQDAACETLGEWAPTVRTALETRLIAPFESACPSVPAAPRPGNAPIVFAQSVDAATWTSPVRVRRCRIMSWMLLCNLPLQPATRTPRKPFTHESEDRWQALLIRWLVASLGVPKSWIRWVGAQETTRCLTFDAPVSSKAVP